jgi:prepilin-type N-terminal cleavage/methylation domain-containing protein
MRLSRIQVKKFLGQNKTGMYGFTLVELLIVILIVGILAALAMTMYTGYQKKAKMVEAKMGLKELAQLQATFFGVNDTYTTDLALLGFSLEGDQRYVYTVPLANSFSFQASATANLDDDTTLDVWTMNEQFILTHDSVD